MTEPAFCTILARNYLPKALALNASLRRHGYVEPLTVVLIDVEDEDELPRIDGVRWMTPFDLGLPRREVLDLATGYDLVEFATAVKPLVLESLLDRKEYAAYLDPDTYVVSPMRELEPALRASSGGIVLTPHFYRPVPDGVEASEGHLLNVGVYNLGFCAVDRRAVPFLQWWWRHLREECLHDPVAGLFVDQKWVDIGAVLFRAEPLQHLGYNVSIDNLHERSVMATDDGPVVRQTGEALRLFHFHAFDETRPDELCRRGDESTAYLTQNNPALAALCREYAAIVVQMVDSLGPQPPYRFATDSSGHVVTRRIRAAHRAAVARGDGPVPSPFLPEEAVPYRAWRRQAWPSVTKIMSGDVAKALRCALPEEYGNLKRRFPQATVRLRRRFISRTGRWT